MNENIQTPIARGTFVMEYRDGLHARPAEMIIKCVSRFESEVTVELRGETIDARSLLGLLSLAAGWQSRIAFTARGTDAAEVIRAIGELFSRRFVPIALTEQKQSENLEPS